MISKKNHNKTQTRWRDLEKMWSSGVNKMKKCKGQNNSVLTNERAKWKIIITNYIHSPTEFVYKNVFEKIYLELVEKPQNDKKKTDGINNSWWNKFLYVAMVTKWAANYSSFFEIFIKVISWGSKLVSDDATQSFDIPENWS